MGGSGSKTADLNPEAFNPDILNLVPADVRIQLEKYAESRENVLRELTESYERLKVDSDQRLFEIEKQLHATTEKYEKEANSSKELHQQLTELEKKYNETANKVRELQATQFEKDERCNALEQINRQLSSEKQELSDALDKKTHEVEQLTAEWKLMSERLAEANKSKVEALTKLGEIQSENVTSQHREERMKQELENIQQENTWLQSELQEKTNQLLAARKENSGKILELETKLNEKSDEVAHLKQLVDSLKQCNEDQNTKIESYIQKLKDARDIQAQMEEHYKTELQSQERLAEIYKTAADKKEKQVNELLPAVEELQKLLKEAANAQSDLENEREAERQNFEALIKERDDQIRELKRELEDANELIEAMKKKGILPPTEENIEALSPAAAAASRLLKSGMTLTQIYSEYVKTCEALQLKEEENKRLNEDLHQIMEEIEEKAPILMKQRKDYETALETINKLTSQLDTAVAECEKLRVQYDEAERIVKELTRENKRLQQTVSDLAQQVRLLLKELEQARGTVVTMSTGPDVSSTDVSSTSQIISENLVTFRSIEELQEQNQRLLEVVRELSEEKDKAEAESTEEKVKDLKAQLDKAMREIEEMEASRRRQAEMVTSIVRQRDMYKLMLQQSSASPGSLTSPMFSSTMVQVPTTPHLPTTPGSVPQSPVEEQDKKTLDDTLKSMKELQEEFSLYRREKSENEKMLNEQVEKLRTESSELRVVNAKLSSQLDFSMERFKTLQSNVNSYKKEISLLKEKAEKLSASNAKYEEVNSTYRMELMATQEKLSRAEAQCQSLRIEKDMLKSIEQRLLQEKESLCKDLKSRDLLMANLQSIQNNLERAEFEAKTRYQQKIESLEKDNAILHRKLENLNEESNRRQMDLEKQLSCARAELDRERSELLSAKEQLRITADEVKQLKEQLLAAEKKLSSQTEIEGVKKTSSEDTDIQAQLRTAQSQIQSLTSQLESALKQVDQYKAIAENVEVSLEEQNKVSKELELRVANQLEETKKVEKMLQQEIQKLSEANKVLQTENAAYKAENAKLVQESQISHSGQQSRCETLNNELVQLREEKNEILRQLEVAKEDLAQQVRLATEAEENYKRELMLHANDVAELTSIKQQLDGFNEKLAKAVEDAKSAQRILETKELSWKERESIIKEDHAKLESRVRELQTQNSMLHEQLEEMSNQMLKLQKKTEKDEEEQMAITQSVIHEGENKSSEKLLEVIRFLRKEKDIAETKLDGTQAENMRLTQQLEYLKKQYDDVNKALEDMKQNEQISFETAVQHAELMKKVETLNLLQDSNRMLREERDRAQEQITKLQDKVRELEEELNPLRETKNYLQNQYEVLEVERNSLQAEVQRWKARTNHLIEQCNKSDPEEFKRMMAERDTLKKQLAVANEDVLKLRAELSMVHNQVTQLQTELNTTKQEIQKLNEEITALKSSVEAKDKEIKEMGEKMIQLRKIGRKYRMQAEEVQRQLDELKASTVQQQLEETHKALVSDLENKLKKAEEELASITENLAVAESEKNNALKIVKEQEANVAKLMEELKTVNEELSKEKEDSAKEKEATIKAREEVLEQKKKYNKSCTVLAGAKEKLSSQKTEIDKLSAENKVLTEKISSLEQKMAEFEAQASALKSHYEGRLGQLQKELESRPSHPDTNVDSATELDKLRKDNAELSQKLQHLQKQFEAHQKQAQPTAATKPTVSAAPVERPGLSAEAVKTANIKPMTTPTTSSRPIQSAMVQPVRSSGTDSRIRASVQPMAVSTVSTTSTQATPTATVMPVSVQESDTTQQVAPLSQMSPQHIQQQVRPMQQVQPVSHVEDVVEQEPTVVQEQEPAVVISQSVTQSAGIFTQTTTVPVSTPPHSVTTPAVGTPPQTMTAPAQDSSVPSQSTTVASTEESPAPSQTASTATISSKRPRDEGDSCEEQTMFMKRTKTQQVVATEVISSVSAEPEVEAQHPEGNEDYAELSAADRRYPEEQAAVDASTSQEASNASTSLDVEPESVAETQSEEVSTYEEAEEEHEEVESEEGGSDAQLEDQDTRDSAMVEEEQGDAIVLTSDEEGNEYDEGPMDGYDEEEDHEGMQEDDEEVVEGGVDEPMADEDDDGDVIVVDEDEEQSPEEASMDPPPEEPHGSHSESHSASQTQSTARNLSQLSRVASHTERLIPASRTQQLPPFNFGEGGSVEVGDDGIVPSTPTLPLPRRNDDFAEAVSSPQVQRRFVFGAASEGMAQHTDFGRLEMQGEFGVDDIRMDLTQLDDASGSGRSVPVMPPTQTTPTISITEASPPREGGTSAAEQEPIGQTEIQQTVQQSDDQGPTAMSPQCESSQDSTGQAEMPIEGSSEKPQPSGSEQSGEGKQESQIAHDDKQEEKSDKPGTSETDHKRTDASTSGSGQKPRIQRITWDNPGTSGSTQQLSAAATAKGTIQRRLRGQGRGFRMQRPMQRSSDLGEQQPVTAQGTPQLPVTHRGRGMRGQKRGQFHGQPPF